MSRTKKPLTDTEIRKAKPKEKEYPLSDGNGLILRVKPNGSKIWLFNYYHPVTKKEQMVALECIPKSNYQMLVLNVKNIVRYLLKVSIHKKKKIRIQQEYENRLKDTFRSVAEKLL